MDDVHLQAELIKKKKKSLCQWIYEKPVNQTQLYQP